MPVKTKQYNYRVHTSTKLTPIQASLKKSERVVYKNFLDKRNKRKTKFQANDLVRTTDLRRIFSKGDTTNWFHDLYKITEIFKDTITSYRIDELPERYNEAMLKVRVHIERKNISLEGHKLKLHQIACVHQCLCYSIYMLTLKHNHILQQECFLKT